MQSKSTVQSKGLTMSGYLEPKGKGIINLPWIATFINEVDFLAGPAFPFPASEALPVTYDSWVGCSNVSVASFSGKHN